MKSHLRGKRAAAGLTPLVGAAAVLLVCGALLPGFQEKPKTPKTAGQSDSNVPAEQVPKQKGSIEGTVADAITGKPLKDVTLLLVQNTGSTSMATAKSDEAGHFIFENLAPASYALIGSHPRYAQQPYGSRNGLLGSTLLTIAQDQKITELKFPLQPNAVVSGKVLDEDGEPMPNIMVAAVRSMYQAGKRIFMPVGAGTSNDLGEFRIANLAAGRYFISATPMNLNRPEAPKAAAGEAEKTYIATYYPNVVETSGAAPVQVTAGGEASGVDIRMARAKSVRVKGKVIGVPQGQTATVRLASKEAGLITMLLGASSSKIKPDGSFEIVGATPGSYSIRVTDQTGIKTMGAVVPLQVADKPIEGILVEVTPNADLAGAVVLEGDDKTSLKGARVVLETVGSPTFVPPNTTVAEDGAFTLKDVPPDRYLVRLMNAPKNVYVKRVQYGPQEMGPEGLNLGVGADKLAVTVSSAGGQIEGVALGPEGNPMSGVTVALVPKSQQYLLYQSTFSDQKGGFSFKGVTPGDYRVYAWEDVEPNAFQDPEFVKPFETKGEGVSLKESDHKGVSLKVIPRQ